MKIKYCVLVMLLLLLYGRLQAQHAAVKPLRINDKVPDVALSMVYYNKPTAKLSDFKNKLVILDFWSTICSSCIHHFAELDSLQQVFTNGLYILPVSSTATGDNAQAVKRFITGYRQRINGGFTLSSVVDDRVLDRLFPHSTIPHYVWIYNGIFISQTSGDEITAANIQTVISNKQTGLRQKKDNAFFDIGRSLLSYTGGNNNNILSQSVLTHKITGLESSLGLTHYNITAPKLYAINTSATGLYRFAYAGMAYLPANRIINEASNKPLFNMQEANPDSEHVYCYELSTAGISDAMLFKRMQEDLAFYFKVQGRMEKRTIKCLVMQIGDSSKLHTAGGIEGNSLYDAFNGERIMINEPLSTLTECLNDLLPMPVTDETGVTKNIDLKLPNNLTDIPALSKALHEQGIILKEEDREFAMLLLSDAPGLIYY